MTVSFSFAQINPVEENFTKKEVYIPMRDGTKLFTIIYIPKDISKSNKYPVIMYRTCYSIAPYGETNFRKKLSPNPFIEKEKYIFVFQDVRGRYMSEGTFTNMTPQVDHKTKKDVDESTDTYDTVDWLVKNVQYNNGKVGQYGTSYPGFYTAVGTLANHPALVASSPQAPISDFWYDDFHHNGAFLMSYFKTFPVFGVNKTKPEKESWFADKMIKPTSDDGYLFYKNMGTLKDGVDKYYKDNFFMQEVVEHPNYDEFWQKRDLLPHLKNIDHAVMTVGGWYDAEDLRGPLEIYKTIEKTSPKAKNTIVMGPFSHGGWNVEYGKHFHNDIYFGDSIATFYQKNIEQPFFHHYLKEDSKTAAKLPEAYMFDTGKKQWEQFENWPPKQTQKVSFYLDNSGALAKNILNQVAFSEYTSDPNKPVLSSENYKDMNGFTPRNYMSEDQRFTSYRPDVSTFTTDILDNDVTFAGEILTKLKIASTSTDVDFVVKLIDVYPADEKADPNKPNVVYGNYHQMVRSEIMPARFRNSFEKPETLIPNKEEIVNVKLQDVLHTFKKGHKIQIQLQSTWFPLMAINPQKFLENPYKATKEDYTKAHIKIFNSSSIEVDVLK
ncbi:putative CocE/NonD family hydrolase [Epilithonimonas hungarica]|uniref:CocE/NonD family hydrolase n=1 Tax=Epilithonimonas hungarica TaxID=454006 RepID=UPI002787598A|nr:CocE/NonD family hydrolase [Epilithonimonas hungarica]MDP9957943.1 putative CocE/NonD family hydrolase [Epilithonimonas hungarica]